MIYVKIREYFIECSNRAMDVRFDFELLDSNKSEFTEIFYNSTLIHILKQRKMHGCNATSFNRINKSELKSMMATSLANRKLEATESGPTPLGYDDQDSFVDNSEPFDEILPEDMETQLGGYYVNAGVLKLKESAERVKKQHRKLAHKLRKMILKKKTDRPSSDRTLTSKSKICVESGEVGQPSSASDRTLASKSKIFVEGDKVGQSSSVSDRTLAVKSKICVVGDGIGQPSSALGNRTLPGKSKVSICGAENEVGQPSSASDKSLAGKSKVSFCGEGGEEGQSSCSSKLEKRKQKELKKLKLELEKNWVCLPKLLEMAKKQRDSR